MKFLIDESSGRKLFLFLKEKGFDVKFVAEIIPRVSDKEVLEFSEKENRILVTNDKDFGELIYKQKFPHKGVILFRMRNIEPICPDLPIFGRKILIGKKAQEISLILFQALLIEIPR